jgi:hypothetical protein
MITYLNKISVFRVSRRYQCVSFLDNLGFFVISERHVPAAIVYKQTEKAFDIATQDY